MTDSRPLALVTGASSGIGLELARQFADHGFDLIVNAEDAGLAPAAQQLRSSGATVQEVQADLRTADGVNAVWAAVGATGRALDAAALNAGVGRGGASANDCTKEVGTKAQGLAAKVLPDSVKGAMHRQMAEPGSAE